MTQYYQRRIWARTLEVRRHANNEFTGVSTNYTIYLLKKAVTTLDAALDVEKQTTRYNLASTLSFTGALFVGDQQQSQPKWVGLLNPFLQTPVARALSANNDEFFCHIEGTPTVPLNGILPGACSLFGIENRPLSASNPEDVRWLIALTAPGDVDGRLRLRLGLDILKVRKPRIEHGCVLDVLPRLEPNLPRDAAVVVYHAMTLHHLRDEEKLAFQKLLQRIGAKRRTFELGVEWAENMGQARSQPSPVELTFTEWTVNGPQMNRIGETDLAADGILLKFS